MTVRSRQSRSAASAVPRRNKGYPPVALGLRAPRAPVRLHHRYPVCLETAPPALPVTDIRCVADHRPQRSFGIRCAHAFTEVADAELIH